MQPAEHGRRTATDKHTQAHELRNQKTEADIGITDTQTKQLMNRYRDAAAPLFVGLLLPRVSVSGVGAVFVSFCLRTYSACIRQPVPELPLVCLVAAVFTWCAACCYLSVPVCRTTAAVAASAARELLCPCTIIAVVAQRLLLSLQLLLLSLLLLSPLLCVL